MSEQVIWITFILMAVLTYGLRFSFIALSGRVDLPMIVRRVLNYAPAAVLFALILPAILVRQQALAFTWDNGRIWAGLVAAVVAWWTQNIAATIVIGMLVLWVWQVVLG